MGDSPERTRARTLFSVEGKVVVVTGGTSGIGHMIAGGFVGAGAEVIVASRKVDAVERTVLELSRFGSCSGSTADLSNEEGARRFANEIRKSHRRVDVLINNAGATWGAPIAEHDTSSWDRVLNLNIQGVFRLFRNKWGLGPALT